MINFFISIFVFAVSVFVLGVSIRFGLTGTGRLDEYLSAKTDRSFTGYPWYYRLPFIIGFIPEYFFFLVIGRNNYFSTKWWSLKTSGFLSILLAVALLKSRSMVLQYFSFSLVNQKGVAALFTSGNFVWFLNIIVLLYLALFVLLFIESVKMHGIYSPVRILTYSLLGFMMALLTVITLGLIVAVGLVYAAYKIIAFLFFSGNRSLNQSEDEESAGDILKSGMRSLKQEVLEWEQDLKVQRQESENLKQVKTNIKPVVEIKRKPVKVKEVHKNDVPRLYPD